LSLKGVTIFCDRDGTINRDTGYVRTPDELELLPGVVESLARLNRAGARLVLVTNQSGIARGFLTPDTLTSIHAGLQTLLQAGGARVDAIYYCPHNPDEDCSCRKPQTGMVRKAVADLAIDLSQSYVVGDQKCDVELARRIGARSVLITTGPTSVQASALMKSEGGSADYIAGGLTDAVDWIFEDVKARGAKSH
jgi:heptosyltransferase-2